MHSIEYIDRQRDIWILFNKNYIMLSSKPEISSTNFTLIPLKNFFLFIKLTKLYRVLISISKFLSWMMICNIFLVVREIESCSVYTFLIVICLISIIKGKSDGYYGTKSMNKLNHFFDLSETLYFLFFIFYPFLYENM